MLDIIIVFGIVVVAYCLLRAQGGHGTTISFKLPPSGTPKGNQVRATVAVVMVLCIGGALFAAFGTGLPRQQAVFIFVLFLAIVLVGFLARLPRKRN